MQQRNCEGHAACEKVAKQLLSCMHHNSMATRLHAWEVQHGLLELHAADTNGI